MEDRREIYTSIPATLKLLVVMELREEPMDKFESHTYLCFKIQ